MWRGVSCREEERNIPRLYGILWFHVSHDGHVLNTRFISSPCLNMLIHNERLDSGGVN